MVVVYKNMDDCLSKYKEADVLINFASLRSAYDSTMEVLEKHPQVHISRYTVLYNYSTLELAAQYTKLSCIVYLYRKF